MRAITVILLNCLILGNFIQRAYPSDRRGAIGRNIKQNSILVCRIELIFSLQIGFVSVTVFHSKTVFQNSCVFSKYEL